MENGFVVVAQGKGATTSELRFALPEYEEEELSRDESAEEETVTFRWRGDEIVGRQQRRSLPGPASEIAPVADLVWLPRA